MQPLYTKRAVKNSADALLGASVPREAKKPQNMSKQLLKPGKPAKDRPKSSGTDL